MILAPSGEAQIVFAWNTFGVFPLKYIISAVAETVEGETRIADNTFVDGTITILPYPPFFPTLDWLVFIIIVVIAAIAGTILLFLLLAMGRMRRRRRRPVYTVIAHPHI
jgi:phosphotransferase system  glucose/maltose/N-acetylglucosamine-specific IIC component